MLHWTCLVVSVYFSLLRYFVLWSYANYPPPPPPCICSFRLVKKKAIAPSRHTRSPVSSERSSYVAREVLQWTEGEERERERLRERERERERLKERERLQHHLRDVHMQCSRTCRWGEEGNAGLFPQTLHIHPLQTPEELLKAFVASSLSCSPSFHKWLICVLREVELKSFSLCQVRHKGFYKSLARARKTAGKAFQFPLAGVWGKRTYNLWKRL